MKNTSEKIDLSITRCDECGKYEYVNCMITQSRTKRICRDCYYKQLEKETRFKRLPAIDFIFPIYKNGVNYQTQKGGK